MKKLFLLLMTCVCLHTPAAVILNQNFSGTDIFNNASFPIVNPTLNGSSIFFSNMPDQNNILFDLQVIAPGTLQASDLTKVTVTVNFTRTDTDSDPIFYVSDGLNAVGIQTFDNSAGGVANFSATVGATTLGVTGHGSVSGTGFPAVNAAASAQFTVNFSTSGLATLDYSFLGTSNSFTSNKTLDPSRALSIILSHDSNDPSHQVNSLNVLVEGSAVVPEPSSLVMLFSGILALAWYRNSK